MIRFRRTRINWSRVFTPEFLDTRVLYAEMHQALPNVSLIAEIDATAAFTFVQEHLGADLVEFRQFCRFVHDEGRSCFVMSVFILERQRIVVLGTGYAELLFGSRDFGWANALLEQLAAFRLAPASAQSNSIGFAITNMN